ncbi:hypothetical protein AYK25_06190 [Thermoplasmatales archaeon SM1-50]|nr:MAG: hypothetical protein AYK25_06190 [Thermoplasmatales archaeon SM1-50]
MKNTSFDMGKYDLILAGSPTWNGRPSLFMKSFINKAQNIKGKKLAFFSTELSPLYARNQFIEIMNKNLENAELPPVDSFLAMQFRRGKLIDGAQNIDTFVNTVLES